ncbi:pas fold-4 [Lucifera butyrica]|uniref:HTH-type transcriptional regulatory protein TyrR n=1 Tax=Lucifera butyrica TaxID=1351585 RepID=A0A498R4T5_9FIRM|nr:sigma 54-interacting transcriptional regulator [Lucifera butyrica]VBB05820.1 pas fold-4 [Lucifera butyrica]
MHNLCLKIPNVDRVGLVLDISRVLAERHINIVSMEVELNTVYLETEQLSPADQEYVREHIKNIPQVNDVFVIELMPHQEKAEQLKAVLTSVSDGIIAIDHQSRITQYNPAAEKIVHIPAVDVLGKSIREVFPSDLPLLAALQQGTVYNNREIMLDRTKSHFLASGRPVKDQTGRSIGAVAILKDISDVRALIYTVTGQLTLTFDELLYTSSAMRRVVDMAKAIAGGHSTVLIRGETGTGKELLARALHSASPRKDKMLVPLNCAAIPDTLLESELFGYEKGAFTGATKSGKQGLFEFANEGTIFLDEIGELSSHLQAKLLRVLQDGKVRRIGGTREIPVNVRILAATNRNLEDMIAKGRFREDLYYRLNVIPLFIPPLRERREDIPILAHFFLRRFAARMQKTANVISETALNKLTHYHWPGNIRELENVIERAVNIVNDTAILAEHIILDHDYTSLPPDSQTLPPRTLDEMIQEVEKDILQKSLRQYRTSRQLGHALGLSHTAILKKLRKYNLSLNDNFTQRE